MNTRYIQLHEIIPKYMGIKDMNKCLQNVILLTETAFVELCLNCKITKRRTSLFRDLKKYTRTVCFQVEFC
jgi:hypothetical protein